MIVKYFMSKQKLKGYCGIDPYGYQYLFISFFISWLFVDFFEFMYHRLGHTIDAFWNVHKFHHQFYNPTPFAVIAEDYIDQIIGASPLFVLPAIVPINIDLFFFQVNILFSQCKHIAFLFLLVRNLFLWLWHLSSLGL